MPRELMGHRGFTSDSLTAVPSAVLNDLATLNASSRASDEHLDQFHIGSVSGRPGTMGLASALLTEFSESNKKIFSDSVTCVLREIGLNQLAEIVEKGSGHIVLAGGIKAKLNFSEKTYDLKDKYILHDDIRKACSKVFQRNNQDIKWVEVKGSIELGEEARQKIALSKRASGVGDLKLSSSLRYRRLELYESPCGMLEKGTTLYNTLQIPITANLANQMPIGSEFEVICEGHALLKPELEASLGVYQTSLTNTSLDSSMTFFNDMEGDVSILVQKLPHANQVLVKIARVDGLSSSAEVKFSVKTKTSPQALIWFRGLLSSFIDKLRWFDWIKSIFDYQASVKLEDSVKESRHEVKRYAFDLSKPCAQMAYNEIFSQFSTKKADELVDQKEIGIRSQGGGEVGSSHEYYGDAKIGETQFWLHQSLQNEREAKLMNNPDEMLLFRESKFSKKYFNWFSGEKTINWESVVLKDKAMKKSQSYYHLTFKNNDRITKQQEINAFLNFSKTLGVDIADPKFRKHVDVENLSHIFANRDDTMTSVDIYFTDRGIQKIKKATRNQLMSAYLKAQMQMELISKPIPFLQKNKNQDSYQLMKKYADFKNKGFLSQWWYRHEMKQLEDRYLDLTGQKLAKDFSVFNEAQKFAQKIMSLNKQDSQNQDEKLFSLLGRFMGFDYMKTIAAMSLIAGEEETFIHGLSMSAGGVSLCCKDEGEIIHPEREVTAALASLA